MAPPFRAPARAMLERIEQTIADLEAKAAPLPLRYRTEARVEQSILSMWGGTRTFADGSGLGQHRQHGQGHAFAADASFGGQLEAAARRALAEAPLTGVVVEEGSTQAFSGRTRAVSGQVSRSATSAIAEQLCAPGREEGDDDDRLQAAEEGDADNRGGDNSVHTAHTTDSQGGTAQDVSTNSEGSWTQHHRGIPPVLLPHELVRAVNQQMRRW